MSSSSNGIGTTSKARGPPHPLSKPAPEVKAPPVISKAPQEQPKARTPLPKPVPVDKKNPPTVKRPPPSYDSAGKQMPYIIRPGILQAPDASVASVEGNVTTSQITRGGTSTPEEITVNFDKISNTALDELGATLSKQADDSLRISSQPQDGFAINVWNAAHPLKSIRVAAELRFMRDETSEKVFNASEPFDAHVHFYECDEHTGVSKVKTVQAMMQKLHHGRYRIVYRGVCQGTLATRLYRIRRMPTYAGH